VVSPDNAVLYEHAGKEVLGHPITPDTARKVREMMLGVAKKGGTARRAAVQGYSVAGKTGTAQMKEGRGYSKTAFNASFIGIVPASRPEIVILVTYQKPAYCRSRSGSEELGVPIFNHQGGICAAPTFSRIASKVLRYMAVEPDIPEEIDPELYEDIQEEGVP
jgi:cell division protein FtsI (penicillin-binding protein 3)